MLSAIYEFFGIIEAGSVPPATMSELIPYLLQIFVGLALVSGVFAVIGGIVRAVLCGFRRM